MSGLHDEQRAERVKELARAAGFLRAGIAPAGPLPAEVLARYRRWLGAGMHARAGYLERDVATRFDPSRLLAGARSVLCLAASYAPPETDAPPTPARPFVARYARGRDYHRALRRRARRLLQTLRAELPGLDGRVLVDAGPIAERSLAVAAGLGWIGRNGCLIVPGIGSYVVLCEIVCTVALSADGPLSAGGCGDCRRCVEACPTGACGGDGLIDGRRCLSQQTIENRGRIPPALWPRLGLRLFGCDTCQEVCPYNQGVGAGAPELTGAGARRAAPSLAKVLSWTRGDWDAATRGSALRRATYEMWLRNAALAAGASGDPSLAPLLERLARDATAGEPAVEAARWGRQRLARPDAL